MTEINTPYGGSGSIDLASLVSPGRLARPARLYAVVFDDEGTAGQRQFLVDIPEGSAVFALTAPRVAFLLADRISSADRPALADEPLDAAAIDAWYAALLSCPGLPHGDGEAIPLDRGDRRALTAGTVLTGRKIVWLQAATPILRYPAVAGVDASPPMPLLVIANQISAEVVSDGEIPGGRNGIFARAPFARCPGPMVGRPRHPGGRDAGRGRSRRTTTPAERAEPRQSAGILCLATPARHRRLSLLEDRGAGFRQTRCAGRSAIGYRNSGGFCTSVAAQRRPQGGSARASRPLCQCHRLPVSRDRPGRRLVEGGRSGVSGRRGRYGKTSRPAVAPRALACRKSGKGRRDHGRQGHRCIPDAARIHDLSGAARARADAGALAVCGFWRTRLHGTAPGDVGGGNTRQSRASGCDGSDTRHRGARRPAGASFRHAVASGCDCTRWCRFPRRAGTCPDPARHACRPTPSAGGVGPRDTPARLVLSRLLGWRSGFAHPRYRLHSPHPVGRCGERCHRRRVLGGQSCSHAGLRRPACCIRGRLCGRRERPDLRARASADATRTDRLPAQGNRVGSADRDSGRHRQAAHRRRRTTRLFALVRCVWRSTHQQCAVRPARWIPDGSGHQPSHARRLGIFGIAAGGAHPIDVGTFAAFNSAFGQFTAALLALSGALNTGIEAVPLFARVRPVFEAPLEVEDSRIDPGPLGGHLAVRNLSFRYSADGPWILDNIAFEARPGECVAIVGASGSGKSTILRLLLGFETPARGGVYYDSRDLEKLDLRLVRRQIGTVLETSRLVPGSLYENIAGTTPLSRQQVDEAVRMAGLEADVAAMPMGLETFVMEGGGQVSGGQRQRVMIARALVRRPRLIFFDEATSALDNRTQAIVGASMAAMNATRIVIAHRLSTVRDADRILVLERGRIVESGTYEELITGKGAFYRLAQRQLL